MIFRPLLTAPDGIEDKPAVSALPAEFINKISVFLQSSVCAVLSVRGGFSASANYHFVLQDGRPFFAKGNYPGEMSHGAETLRQEIFTYQNAPVLKKTSPAYIGAVFDGGDDDWSLGFWDFITDAGRDADASFMMAVFKEMQTGDASALPPARARPYIGGFFRDEKKWRRLQDEKNTAEKFCTIFADPSAGAAWLQKNISALVSLQSMSGGPLGPEGLMHGDLRLDNFLFTSSRAFIIDWPNACRGPLLFDVLFLGAHLESLGVMTIDEFIAQAGVDFDDRHVSVLLAALAGYFADQAYRAVPVRLPRLRWMQKSMLLSFLRALARRQAIDSPPAFLGQLSAHTAVFLP